MTANSKMKMVKLTVAALALFSSASVLTEAYAASAFAARLPANANHYYGLYQGPSDGLHPRLSDRPGFDHSGTRGREGLGASPIHPEGPGNVED